MGSLVELGDDTDFVPSGDGQRLILWWTDVADDEDQALFRKWVETPKGTPGRRSYRSIAEALTATGFPVSTDTLSAGVRRLKAAQWVV